MPYNFILMMPYYFIYMTVNLSCPAAAQAALQSLPTYTTVRKSPQPQAPQDEGLTCSLHQARCSTLGRAPLSPFLELQSDEETAGNAQSDHICSHCHSGVSTHSYRFSCLVYTSLYADFFCQKRLGSSLLTLKSGCLLLKHVQFGDEHLSKSFVFLVIHPMYVQPSILTAVVIQTVFLRMGYLESPNNPNFMNERIKATRFSGDVLYQQVRVDSKLLVKHRCNNRNKGARAKGTLNSGN